MSTYKDIETIKQDYDNGDYFCQMSIPQKVSEHHIFDENLSVKRNRELAKEHNDNVQKLMVEKRKENNILAEQLSQDVSDYIVETYNVTSTQAKKIERFVYNHYHDFMSDYFWKIDEFAEFIQDIINSSP
jgi:hypothetical protein